MNAKHTPGPWFVKYGNAIYAADGYEIGVAYYAGNQHANMDDNGLEISRGKNQSEANASLIAAAPDLMEAIVRLEFAAQCRDNTMGDPCRLIAVKAELAAAAAQARAAIAKATGG